MELDTFLKIRYLHRVKLNNGLTHIIHYRLYYFNIHVIKICKGVPADNENNQFWGHGRVSTFYHFFEQFERRNVD